jgi:uncharacterized protein
VFSYVFNMTFPISPCNYIYKVIFLLILVCLFIFGGCASLKPIDMGAIKSGFNRSESSLLSLERAVFSEEKGPRKNIDSAADPILLLELGVAYSYQGRFEESNKILEEVYRYYQMEEDRSKISLSKAFLEAAESSLTEGLGNYQLDNYEKVFLHSIKTINFLMLGNPNGARVEVERAYILQKNILEKSESELVELKKKYENKLHSLFDRVESRSQISKPAFIEKFSTDRLLDRIDLSRSEKQITQTVRSSYENAFTEVLSSLTFQLNGESGNALPPLKRAVKITDNQFVKRVKEITEKDTDSFSRNDNFYLFVFKGFAPEKRNRSLTFSNPFTGAINHVSIARLVPQNPKKIDISLSSPNSGSAITPSSLTNINALALKQYEEELPYLVIKAMTRLAGQVVKDYYLRKELGQGGAMLASILNLAIERADIRAWTLLPEKILFLSQRYNTEKIRLSIAVEGKRISKERIIPIEENEITVAFARVFDNDVKLYYHKFPRQ